MATRKSTTDPADAAAVEENAAPAVDPAVQAKEDLATALRRRPGLEAELGSVIDFVGGAS